jgi:hypothetical protein
MAAPLNNDDLSHIINSLPGGGRATQGLVPDGVVSVTGLTTAGAVLVAGKVKDRPVNTRAIVTSQCPFGVKTCPDGREIPLLLCPDQRTWAERSGKDRPFDCRAHLKPIY